MRRRNPRFPPAGAPANSTSALGVVEFLAAVADRDAPALFLVARHGEPAGDERGGSLHGVARHRGIGRIRGRLVPDRVGHGQSIAGVRLLRFVAGFQPSRQHRVVFGGHSVNVPFPPSSVLHEPAGTVIVAANDGGHVVMDHVTAPHETPSRVIVMTLVATVSVIT